MGSFLHTSEIVVNGKTSLGKKTKAERLGWQSMSEIKKVDYRSLVKEVKSFDVSGLSEPYVSLLDSLKPYNLIFIQKASPVQGDAFDMAFVYKFFTERNEKTQRLKYIIRVEKHNNAFALKFYAARDRKNINKYHRIINAHDYKNLVRLLLTCFEVIPDILSKYPTASFVVNGANSRDLRTHTEENSGYTRS